MDYNFIDIENQRYIIKKTYSLDMVKDLGILSEFKWLWSADTIIKSEPTNKLYLVQRVDDAVILELLED